MTRTTLWLIGGTQESAVLARAIATCQIPCLITVTTISARSLYPDSPWLTLWVGRVTADTLTTFLTDHAIAGILDASHPFALDISQLAIATAARFHLPYLRFERPSIAEMASALAPNLAPLPRPATVYTFPTFQAFLATELLRSQRALLTVGYRPLIWFQPWQQQATLFARILPSVTALDAAIAAGFTPDRLIALRPPISVELEHALWQQWQISMVITKASGVAGGEDTKRQVAAQQGVTLVTIARPDLAYPHQTSDIDTAIQFCEQIARSPQP